MNEILGGALAIAILMTVVLGAFVVAKDEIESRIDERKAMQMADALVLISEILKLEDGERKSASVYLPFPLKSEENSVVFRIPTKSQILFSSGNVIITSYGEMTCSVQKIGGTDYIVMDNGIISVRLRHYSSPSPYSGIIDSMSVDGNTFQIYDFRVSVRGVEPSTLNSSLVSSPILCKAYYTLGGTNSTLVLSLYPGADHIYGEVV